MNLYLLTQNDNGGYDTYDAIVVAAKNEDDAKQITPYGDNEFNHGGTWADSIDGVKVEYLGNAKQGTERGIILSSFHAG